jgi:hypothetical protein
VLAGSGNQVTVWTEGESREIRYSYLLRSSSHLTEGDEHVVGVRLLELHPPHVLLLQMQVLCAPQPLEGLI